MKKSGLYIIKDRFFKDFPDPYLKGNKEENRPHYYCFKDEKDGVFWVIPLSSQVDKYKNIIDKRESKGKECNSLHVAKLDNGKESAFLIQDMFPIIEEYIEREYTFAGQHMVVTSERLIKTIDRKARNTLSMIKRGKKYLSTQPDVLRILKKLKENNNDSKDAE